MTDSRFLKHINIISENGLEKIKNSKVAIIGLGGLGGVMSELLCRYGVGKMFIVDGDRFEQTNLNRQLLSNEKTIGLNKAKVAAEKLKSINININLTVFERHLSLDSRVFENNPSPSPLPKGARDNEDEIYSLKTCDVICDCLGDYESKIKLERIAIELKKPIVHAAVENEKFFVGTVNNSNESWENFFGKTGVGIPKDIDPASVWVCASLQAKEVINVLLGKKALQNKLLEGNLSTLNFRVL